MNKKFKLSLIVQITDDEDFLKKTIESIINHEDFEENIQLILLYGQINLDIKETALSYKKTFNENILILPNYVHRYMKHVKGEYLTFIDKDCCLFDNVLEDILKYDYSDFDIFKIETSGNNDALKVEDLIKNPSKTISSSDNLFFRSSLVDEFSMDLYYSKDLLINKILLNNPKYGIMELSRYCEKNNKIEMPDFSKKEDLSFHIRDFSLKLIEYCLKNHSDVAKFIQYAILKDLFEIIKHPELRYVDDEEKFFNHIQEALQNIDDDILMNNNLADDELKHYALYLKYGSKTYCFEDSNVFLNIGNNTISRLDDNEFIYDKVIFEGDYLYISGFFNSYFNINNLSIAAVKEKNGKFDGLVRGTYINDNCEKTRFLSKTWVYGYPFDVKIPLDGLLNSKIQMRLTYHKNGDNKDFSDDNVVFAYPPGKFAPTCAMSQSKYVSKNDCGVCFNQNSFHVIENFKPAAFKFSVVMAIYNTEDYVEEAIDSVINQSIGFEDNIQLILVDDGSEDNTPDILARYQEKYPDNILVLRQENQGQAAARNNGLKYAQGEYVNFLDSDDYLSLDAMEKVYPFIEEHKGEIDFVSIRQNFFGRMNSEHMLNYRFNKGDRIIDLTKNPNNPQLPCNSVFFKKNLFEKYEFPTNVKFSEDAILVNKILFEKKKYGVLSEPVYYYRKREDMTSTIDSVHKDKEFFTDKLKYYFLELINYSLEKEGRVLEFIQYLCAYDLQWMLEQPNLDVFDNQDEIDEFWQYLDYVIDYLDYAVIAKNRNVSLRLRKLFFIYMKNKDLHVEFKNGDVLIKSNGYKFDNLKRNKLWLDIIEVRKNNLIISGFFNSQFDIDNISIEALTYPKDGDVESYYGEYVKYTGRPDLTYLGIPWEYNHNFDIRIPLAGKDEFKVKIRVNYHKNGDKTDFDDENIISAYLKIRFLEHAYLSAVSNYTIQEDKFIYFNKNTFFVYDYRYKSMIKKEYGVLKRINKDKQIYYRNSLLLRFLHLIMYPFMRNRKIYLFMDRGTEAGDNAMHLFKYASSVKDDVSKYYVLSKEDKDYKKLSKFGKMIDYKSFKHKFVYLFADKIISSHPYESFVNPFFTYDGKNNRLHFSGVNSSKKYFLQHGVAKDNISSWFSKFDKNVSLIVTSSDKERESFYDEGYGFDKGIVQTLGLPRHDSLIESKPKKQILISPSWRKTLRGNKKKFKNSDYFILLNNLLNNDELIKIANEKGYELVFKAHPELNKTIDWETGETYVDLIEINDSIRVSTEESYQELFNDSALMITDYSSVFFDFAYLKKPVIYYQPTDDYHYEKSYFDYETMGFGDVIKTEEDLLSKIKYYLENNCTMEDKYKENVDKFFKYHDHNNCKRVYDWIYND